MTDPVFWADLNRSAALDVPPERLVQQLTQFAADACNAPFARTTLITERGQRFDCIAGLKAGSEDLPAQLEVCADILLNTPRALALGNLRVFDRTPRMLDPLQQDALQLIALQIVHHLELRRVADDLRRQSLLLASTQSTANIGGWEIDLFNDHLTWTEETYRIHEVTSAQYAPSTTSSVRFNTPASEPLIRAAVRNVAASGRPFDLEMEIITHLGHSRWVRVVGFREDLDGVPRRLFGVIQDITQRRRLESEILLIAQREQNRIGFDLHDGLGQELTGISLLLHNITGRLPEALPGLRAELVHIEKLVRAAIGTCRLLAHGLSPVSRERGGLQYALLNLATQTDHLQDSRVEVTLRGPEPEIGEMAADHLYRIAQEAVNNAIRHARPRRVTVSMEVGGGDVRLMVSDDGVGMADCLPAGGGTAWPPPPEAHDALNHDGMGLRIMQYRAGLIGAALSFERRREGGTLVICHLTNPGAQDRPNLTPRSGAQAPRSTGLR